MEATKLPRMAQRNQFPLVCLHKSGIHMKEELLSFVQKCPGVASETPGFDITKRIRILCDLLP